MSKYSRLLVLMLAVAVVGIVLNRRPPPRSLLQRATLLAYRSNLAGEFWLDGQTLLILEMQGSNSLRAVRMDIRNGSRQPLPALTATLKRLGMEGRRELSPDGRWLLVVPYKQMPQTHCLVSVQTGAMTRRQTTGPFLGWQADSRGWLTWNGPKKNRYLCLYRVDNNKEHRLPAMQSPIQGMDLGFAPNGHFFVADWQPYQTAGLTLHEEDLLTGTLKGSASIPNPPQADVSGVCMSPDGKRLAWHVRPDGRSPLARIGEFLATWRRNEATRDALWVSGIDGKGMQHMGEVEVQYGHDYDSNLSLSRWTPDGKHLSFTYNDGLYIVPVE